MPSGITQLIVEGKQDEFITGNPEITYFNKSFNRHSNFSMFFDKHPVEGYVQSGGRQIIKFTKGSDLIGNVFIRLLNNNNTPTSFRFLDIIDRVELCIGGHVIDSQRGEFLAVISPTVDYTTDRHMMAQGSNDITQGYLPLSFFFNKSVGSMLPLVALTYSDVEIRIYYTPGFANRGQKMKSGSDGLQGDADGMALECITQSIILDNFERNLIAKTPTRLLISQTQTIASSGTPIQELQLHSPVSYIVGHIGSAKLFATDTGGNYENNAWMSVSNRIKLQINGTDITPWMVPYSDLGMTTMFHHAPGRSLVFFDSLSSGDHDTKDNSLDRMFLFPFGLTTTSFQPTGTLNFSMIDDARFISESSSYPFKGNVYAVNFNILRIENGIGGLVYI